MPRIARWITSLAAFAWVATVSGPATAAEPDAPTVTFGWSGGTTVCGSLPDIRTLSVPEGAQIMVVNATGADATVVVGGEDIMNVPVGAGASLTLSPGEHVVTMVPACQLQSAIGELTVTVTSAADTTVPPSAGAPQQGGADEQIVGEPGATPAIGPAAARTGASSPVGSDPLPPSAANAPDRGTGWRELAATPVDPDDGQSPPPFVPLVASILLVGVIGTIMWGIVRSRKATDAEHQSPGQLPLDRPGLPLGGGAASAADADLRDQLRELVQAAHRGADPRKVEAARRELFAQLPHSDHEAQAALGTPVRPGPVAQPPDSSPG